MSGHLAAESSPRSARRWWALGALTLATLAISLPTTALNVALPTLADELGATSSELQWFVSAYALALVSFMLPAGLLGDRFGRKTMLLVGLVVFAGASTMAAMASSPGAFLAAMIFIGLGAAMVTPLVVSALTVVFSEDERPKAVGAWAAANFLALPLGPIVGGWVLSSFWWGWLFLMNIPIIVIAGIAVIVFLPQSRSTQKPRIDILGVVLSSAGVGFVTYGLIETGSAGWGSASALIPIGGGIASLVLFALWQIFLGRRPSGSPLVPPALFRSRRFLWGTLMTGVGIFALYGVIYVMPQFFQAVDDTDAFGSGLRLIPLLIGVMVGATTSARLAALCGAKLVIAAGFVVMAASVVWGTSTAIDSEYVFIGAWLALTGLGVGWVMATGMSTALDGLQAERSGVGSAVNQAIQRLGTPFAAAILGSILTSTYADSVSVAGLPGKVADVVTDSVFAGVAVAKKVGSDELLHQVRSAFVNGMTDLLWVAAAVAAFGIILTLVTIPGKRAASADKAKRQTDERAHTGSVKP